MFKQLEPMKRAPSTIYGTLKAYSNKNVEEIELECTKIDSFPH